MSVTTGASSNARQAVEALLAAQAITPSAAEIDELVAAYQPTRSAVEVLYEMPGTRYEEPAVTFDARI